MLTAYEARQLCLPEDRGEKRAWIDYERRVISFHWIDRSVCFSDKPEAYWEAIFKLTQKGFRVQ